METYTLASRPNVSSVKGDRPMELVIINAVFASFDGLELSMSCDAELIIRSAPNEARKYHPELFAKP
jgi:hypothetical protein